MATQNATTVWGGYLTNQQYSSFYSWSEIVYASSATSTTGNNSTMITEASYISGRGATWRCRRSYLVFDTSAITGTVTSLSLKAYCTAVDSSSYRPRVIPQITDRPDLSNSLTSADWDFETYSSAISSEIGLSTSAWNTWTLDGSAMTYVESNSEMTIVLRDNFYDYDYANNLLDPPGTGSATFYYNTAGFYPYLEYTMVTGYGNTVNGVVSANIGYVNGVAKANIFKVNGV